MNEFWDETTEYDEVAEELKETLRSAVKKEITAKIDMLTIQNRELKDKLKGLDTLEREAAQAKARFDSEYNTAKYQAGQDVRKLALAELLAVIDERLFTVEMEPIKRPKCDRCDEARLLAYTTPRGRETCESCECAEPARVWKVEEVAAHEVSRNTRSGRKFNVWWAAVSKWRDEDCLNPRWLVSADGVAASEVAKNPSKYSFKDRAAAQAAADAANAPAVEVQTDGF
jgi:hypothetical protein